MRGREDARCKGAVAAERTAELCRNRVRITELNAWLESVSARVEALDPADDARADDARSARDSMSSRGSTATSAIASRPSSSLPTVKSGASVVVGGRR